MSVMEKQKRIKQEDFNVARLYANYINNANDMHRVGKKFKDSNGNFMSSARVTHGFVKYMHDVVWPEIEAQDRRKKNARKRIGVNNKNFSPTKPQEAQP